MIEQDTVSGVEIECVHCGTYPVTKEQGRDLHRTHLLLGFRCYRCDEECNVRVNGKRASLSTVWDATKNLS